MSFVPATSHTDLWAVLGVLLSIFAGVAVWNRREDAAADPMVSAPGEALPSSGALVAEDEAARDDLLPRGPEAPPPPTGAP